MPWGDMKRPNTLYVTCKLVWGLLSSLSVIECGCGYRVHMNPMESGDICCLTQGSGYSPQSLRTVMESSLQTRWTSKVTTTAGHVLYKIGRTIVYLRVKPSRLMRGFEDCTQKVSLLHSRRHSTARCISFKNATPQALQEVLSSESKNKKYT